MIYIISDGVNDKSAGASQIASDLAKAGIQIFALAVGSDARGQAFLRNLTSKPRNRHFMVYALEEKADVLSNWLINSLCSQGAFWVGLFHYCIFSHKINLEKCKRLIPRIINCIFEASDPLLEIQMPNRQMVNLIHCLFVAFLKGNQNMLLACPERTQMRSLCSRETGCLGHIFEHSYRFDVDLGKCVGTSTRRPYRCCKSSVRHVLDFYVNVSLNRISSK